MGLIVNQASNDEQKQIISDLHKKKKYIQYSMHPLFHYIAIQHPVGCSEATANIE